MKPSGYVLNESNEIQATNYNRPHGIIPERTTMMNIWTMGKI
jgi:hypothetical protein